MQAAATTVDPLEPAPRPRVENTPFTRKNVFISYAHEDQEFVRDLAEDLKKCGAKVWLDLEIRVGGESWPKQLEEALRAADEFLLVVSPDSQESAWVGKELAAADARKTPIIPILLREPNEQWLFIADFQWIDFTGSYEEGFKSLMARRATIPPKWTTVFTRYLRRLLLAVAIIATIAAALFARYQLAPSDTHFTVVGANEKHVVLRVENRGGKPAMLLGGTFKIDFGNLPIEAEELVVLDAAKAARIRGHSNDTTIRLELARILTPKKRHPRAYWSEERVKPLIPGATLTITGQIKESGERLQSRTTRVAGARLHAFILEGFPDEVPDSDHE